MANLSSYNVKANVTENTNGLKTVTKKEDGSFSFSAAKTDGTDSGISDQNLQTVDESSIIVTLKGSEGVGKYGEFIRVDLTGSAYGDLGANMQAVTWTYYGKDSSRTTSVGKYGTKFAADNWMHSSQGIQLGLTNSVRCQLPDGYDGTGYWTVTIHALGYADYTVEVLATEDNIFYDSDLEALKTSVEEAQKQKETLEETDYTTDSWASFTETLTTITDELNATNPTLYKKDVQDYSTKLKEAVDGLTKLDLTALNAAITEASAITADGYTTDSYKALTDPLAAANAIVKNGGTQDEADAAATALTKAISGLTKLDLTALNKAITKASSYKSSDYTTASYKTLTTALTAAQNIVKNGGTQAEADAATKTLNTAISGLKKKPTTSTKKKKPTITVKKKRKPSRNRL